MAGNAFHLSLNVTNLEYSVGFYRLLFGVDPTKWFADYAKFELESPALVLSLEPTAAAPGGTLNHLGIRVESVADIDAFERRLGAVGVELQRLTDIECCYSRQTKIVFRDPDRNLVEVYVVEGESARKEPAAEKAAPPVETAPASAAPTWEHLVGTAVPETIPAKDASLSEVRLRGTFNRREEFAVAAKILRESARALEPGGRLLVHLLVASHELPGDLPALPPPADNVRFVPVQAEVVRVLEEAGFSHVEVKRLSHSPVMQLGGIELRELLLHATKPYETMPGNVRDVVYRGPFASLEDDRGRRFARGRRVALGEQEIAWLEERGWLGEFIVLNGPSDATCGT